jgi:allophanate hydrolase subunit 1
LLAGVMVDIASLSAASFSTAGLGFFGGVVYLFMVPETLKLSKERITNKT